MKYLIKSFSNLIFLVILFSCSSAEKKPISFWVFDLENKQLINSKSEMLKYNDPKLNSIACLNKEDLIYLYQNIGEENGQCMDSKPSLGGNKPSEQKARN